MVSVLYSVQLARRVLQLERSNAALHKELERLKLESQQLAEQASSSSLKCFVFMPVIRPFLLLIV